MAPFFLVAVMMTASADGAGDDEKKPDKVIEIVSRDGKLTFVEKGKDDAGTITVVVGQKVRWVNRHSQSHHFASTIEVDGKPVIDLGSIEPGKHRDLHVDNDLYRAAGGKTASLVTITFRSRESGPDPSGKLEILSPAKR